MMTEIQGFHCCTDDALSSLDYAEGVYVMERNGEILYVGTSDCLARRVRNSHPVIKKHRPLRIHWKLVQGRAERHLLEISLIRDLKPTLNKSAGSINVANGRPVKDQPSFHLSAADRIMIEEVQKIMREDICCTANASDAIRYALGRVIAMREHLAEFVRGGK
jgi:hypothetical protein